MTFFEGNTPWNKGKKVPIPLETRKKISEGLKRYFTSPDARKKLSDLAKKKGWKPPGRRTHYFGEQHQNWKGEKASYKQIHIWVAEHLGKPNICEHCGNSGFSRGKITWANKDHKYRRKLEDWMRLCMKCHQSYDRRNGMGRWGHK